MATKVKQLNEDVNENSETVDTPVEEKKTREARKGIRLIFPNRDLYNAVRKVSAMANNKPDKFVMNAILNTIQQYTTDEIVAQIKERFGEEVDETPTFDPLAALRQALAPKTHTNGNG